MKLKLVMVLLLFFSIYQRIFPEGNFLFDHMAGNVIFSTDINESANFNFIIDSNNLTWENVKTGIGFYLVPLRYSYAIGKSKQSLSIINANVYWNFLAVFDDKYVYLGPIFGPFAGINYMNLLDIKDFTYKFGLRYLMVKETGSGIIAEVGYKNSNNKPSFYFEVGIDINSLFLLPFAILMRR